MARYDSMRKLTRNKQLVDYKNSHPEESLKEIGAVFNISKQQVSKLLQKYGDRKEK